MVMLLLLLWDAVDGVVSELSLTEQLSADSDIFETVAAKAVKANKRSFPNTLQTSR